MLKYLFFVFVLTIFVTGQNNDLLNNFEPSLDDLVPNKKDLENTRRSLSSSENKKITKLNSINEDNDTPCTRINREPKRQQNASDISRKANLPNVLPGLPNLGVNPSEPKSGPGNLDTSHNEYPIIDEVEYPQHKEELRSLALRSAPSEVEQIDPADLAAELQDCLEKKLNRTKPNVVVVIPVLDNAKKNSEVEGEDVKDEKFFLTFVKQPGDSVPDSKDDSSNPTSGKSNCNKKQELGDANEQDLDKALEDLEKRRKIEPKIENKVQKFLRTGIAEMEYQKNDESLNNVDGRRRNNYYDGLSLNDVVDNQRPEVLKEPTTTAISEMDSNDRSAASENRVCYACSSLNNPSCENPGRMTTVKYCAGSRVSCVKKTYDTLGKTVLIRDCAASCNDNVLPAGIIPKHKTCDLCHSDLCNSAYSIKDQSLLIMLFISSVALCKILA